MKNLKCLKCYNVLLLAPFLLGFSVQGALAVQGTPLPGNKIPQFVDPLPVLDTTASGITGIDTLVAGPGEIELHMRTFQAKIMPSTFVPANGLPYTGTWTFGYVNGPTVPGLRETPVGPVIVATRGVPTQIRYVNNLEASDATIHWRDWTDQTLHSAFHQAVGEPMPMPMPMPMSAAHYTGSVLAVPHLHGGEVPAVIDGGPEAWFASDVSGTSAITVFQGPAYYTQPGVPAAFNEAVYRYPNTQEAAPLWFHDHLLGGTRLNATYGGLAGAYLITDPSLTLPLGLEPAGLGGRLLVPLVIQDRMFDTNGQLFFPNIGVNPEHPFWVPEFVGDTIVVNGKVWPYMNVDRQRYRFFLINGSNSRPYDMFLQELGSGIKGPPMWVIATDGGYLDAPVKIDPSATGQQVKAGVQKSLMMMPGERYEIIVDFNDPTYLAALANYYKNNMPATINLVLRNTAPTVNGNPKANTEGRLMQFRVSATAPADSSYNPASGIAIRSGGQTIVRLPGAPGGPAISTANVNATRLLTLNEVMGAGGPLEALVNNSKWGGLRPDMMPIDGSTLVNGNWLTEFPLEGAMEVWEIVNLTMDSHPIHLHAVQFQLIDRQPIDAMAYMATYNGSFVNDIGAIDPMTGQPYPNGVFIPGYGPPKNYFTGNTRALGGNPDPVLLGAPIPALAHEAGWKDTVIMHPGEKTRIAVRWAPQDSALGTVATFPFAPDAPLANGEPGVYVWHCHITDHEDNEMMRPDVVVSNPAAVRTYIQGVDY